ncbi:hypothetical protein PQX77_002880 [Marasmius sp. AFHP31]|nr:hypothetical protein PQX77_002880 [Marasmius sp. AFHP31]
MEKSGTSGGLDDVRVLVQTAIKDREQYKKVLEARGDEAQQLLNAMQVLAESPDTQTKLRSAVLKTMLGLSRSSGLCPDCLHIRNVKKIGNYPVGGGAFGDVWKGEIDKQSVCLKVVRATLDSDMQQLHKDYMREAIVWKQLLHPNVLPFMGMYYLEKDREQLCLVSPWMYRGNLTRYLNETGRENVDHQSLAHDVASGLAYLHDMKIVHGDLKGVNVLVTPDERACIGDFGLSRIADTHSLHLSASPTGHVKGTVRWLSPELLSSTLPCSASTSSDLYAYACVCYEIFVGRVPFYELREGAVMVAIVIKKEHPTRPTGLSELSDAMWEIMMSCWNHDIYLRPTAQGVLSLIGAVRSRQTGLSVQSHAAPEWDTTPQAQIWKNVQYPSIDTTAVASFLTVRTRASTEQNRPPKAAFIETSDEDSFVTELSDEQDASPTKKPCDVYREWPLRLQYYKRSKQDWCSAPKDRYDVHKTSSKPIVLATWNVDSASPYPRERMRAALDELKDKILPIDEDTKTLQTCVVLLQEVHSSMLEVIQSSLWVRKNFYVAPLNNVKWPSPHTYGNVTLVHRSLQVERAFLLEYRLSPGSRSAIVTNVKLHSDRVLRIINTHLESIPDRADLREEQLAMCVRYCRGEGIDDAVIGGDLQAIDWNSEELGMDDAFRLQPLERPEMGHTWGYQCSNEQDKQLPKGRPDKIIYTPRRGFLVTKPKVVGKGIRDVEGRFISDHYGLVADIRIDYD